MSTNQIIQEMYKSADPVVGMGATFMSASDRNPGTVAKIISPKKIVVTSCNWEVTGGPYEIGEDREYLYFPATEAELAKEAEEAIKNKHSIYTLRKNGRWVLDGSNLKTGSGVMLGARERYSDPSF